MVEKHHPQRLSIEEREEWHRICSRLVELYDKVLGFDDPNIFNDPKYGMFHRRGRTSLILFKPTGLDYVALKGDYLQIDFGREKKE